VVESARPVDGDICLLFVQLHCSKLTKLKKTIKHWTKSSTLTSLHLFAVLRHVVWSDGPQELNVVITVVFCHLFTTGFVDLTYIDLHFPVQSIVKEEVVCHANPVGFHGMSLAIVVVPHITLERKDSNFFLCSLRQRHFTPIAPLIRAHRFLSCTGSSR
uniref:Uncharacterized protein n=1 Tax=Lates calcarifer TaxID=8187 RepID=A0A4W6CGA1_LATCA